MISVISVVIATVAALVVSVVFYGVTARHQSAPPPIPERTPSALIVVELARNAAVSALLAGLLQTADWSGAAAGLALGLSLSIVPLVLLAGSVFHEGTPVNRAILHAVDWVIKLAVIGVIAALFI